MEKLYQLRESSKRIQTSQAILWDHHSSESGEMLVFNPVFAITIDDAMKLKHLTSI